MRVRTFFTIPCAVAAAVIGYAATGDAARAGAPLTVSSVRVTIEGTSKRDPFIATTKTVRVTRVQLSEPRSPDILQQAVRPGGLDAFDVEIPVMTLTSPDTGVDEHIYRSLKADIHPAIRFQLRSIARRPGDETGFVKLAATGALTIAGATRDVTLDITAVPAGRSLLVDGSTDVLMTDFGIKPPKGLLGLLDTDPVIHVRFYLVVTAAA